MTNHVHLRKPAHRDPFHAAQHLHRLDHPGTDMTGEVDLRDVAGDHHFRSEALPDAINLRKNTYRIDNDNRVIA